ncbi:MULTISPECIES: enoyl-CoA hydratase/isomerase family protein [Cytobacillus]|uniref:Enoyl-CoA hydratase n=1 Tax=Cytobacillus oceanisediminis 2691 TaxID=1196031 RepID=A0A169FQD1_9BACI|nr:MULTISPECIES: enoyl-CoA hydratase-related protein [Cytobacillus]MBY0156464.1 enoyl-CoA hydratase/isomerase family protein [Cytobacillus firmus]AND40325.1 enoyl-CoA hydratase [Cytobacillus oceanisediminis 2691]MCM3246247.1 enoyl-CoA hydratase-related protein [Cytobacillus oceanisediminis]MCM3392286.1 enoyl-CoA hydratase-related protein [Cytobacillus oceanisediminis]MCM3530670.1 enoyl-CoA hydratase-related protein [Cytobacillus oceanisediminis]
MDFNNILVREEEGIGFIIINRPELRNALNTDTLLEIESALDVFRDDKNIRVIIFTGAGEKSFAAGADISQLNKRTMIDALKPNMTATYRKIEDYEKPTIAAINGFALGGGMELALACDIRVASLNAKLGLPEVGLGIMPGAGGTQRLSRIIGRGKAMELILTGDVITAAEAERFNLISKAVPLEELMDTAKEYARRISLKGPLAVRMAKAAVNRGADMEMETALYLEKLAQTILIGSEDKLEGTQAFLEKRTPQFKGK